MNREGWKESNFLVEETLGNRLAEVSIRRGWSIDSCVRKAMVAYAKKRGVLLEGGDETRVRRRKAETLRDSDRQKITVTFPETWTDGVRALVEKSAIHKHAAPMWREAVAAWVDSEEKKLARAEAKKPQPAEAAA